jgi:hypothetical protein
LYLFNEMARSHHRKKHKQHVRQFRHSHDIAGTPSRSKSKATSVFTVAGGLLGFAITYFATQGNIIWVAVGLAAGGLIGWLIGKRLDTDNPR